MIKTVLSFLILCISASLSYAQNLQQPSNALQAKQQNNENSVVQKLMPEHWELISYAIGDLNLDKKDDIALLIQPKNKKTGPKLVIYFYKNNSYQSRLSKQFDRWTYEKENRGNAFDESSLSIKNQVLNIRFNDQPFYTNTYNIAYTYRFRQSLNSFKLTGFDLSSADKLSGNTSELSVNLLTKKLKEYTYNLFPDNKIKPYTQWRSLKSVKSYTLESMSFNSPEYYTTLEKQFK